MGKWSSTLNWTAADGFGFSSENDGFGLGWFLCGGACMKPGRALPSLSELPNEYLRISISKCLAERIAEQ